jgi:hypothetical protein
METQTALVLFFVGIGLFVVIAIMRNSAKAEAERIARIRERFGADADRILAKTIWVGETEEQLRASLGEPLDVDQKVLKTKKREIWKYGSLGGNRYSTRITLENGVVSGWDVK